MLITQDGDPTQPDWTLVSDYTTEEVYGNFYLNGDSTSTKLLFSEDIILRPGDYKIYLPSVNFKTMTDDTEYDYNALLYVKNFTFVLEGNKGGKHKSSINENILVQNKGEHNVEISGKTLEVKIDEEDTYKLYINKNIYFLKKLNKILYL